MQPTTFSWRATVDASLVRSVVRSRWLAGLGLELRVLDVDAAGALEPTLAPVSRSLRGAVYFPPDEGGDAHRFCVGLQAYLAGRGVLFKFGATIDRLMHAKNLLTGVRDSRGESHVASTYVLAAASDSLGLARQVGPDLHLRPVNGHSLPLTLRSIDPVPMITVTDVDLHMAVVPLADGRLRVAGTAEVSGFDLRVEQPRVANLLDLLKQVYPAAIHHSSPAVVPWAGLRPMTADGKPLIGETSLDNFYLNTGHGHLGWTLATGSASLLADSIVGRDSSVPRDMFAVARFS